MPWVFWDYRNLVHDIRAAPAGSNVDHAMLSNLDRAYPLAIGGTPSGWTWDSGARRFMLRYSTTLPNGHLAGGIRTEVYLPTLDYPHGYVTHVTGARIISGPNANRLVLENDARSATVEVTVAAR